MIKKYLTVLLIIFFSCNQSKESSAVKNEEYLISGMANEHPLFVNDTVGYLLGYEEKSINIEEKGNFRIPISNLSSDAFLDIGRKGMPQITISRYNKKNLRFEFDSLSEPQLKIRGEQAKFIDYQLDDKRFFKRNYDSLAKKYPEFAKGKFSSPEYLAISDTLTKLRLNFLDNYFKDVEILNKDAFVDDQANSLKYSNLYYKLNGQKTEVIDELGFYRKDNKTLNPNFSEKLDFDSKELLKNFYYQEFIKTFIFKIVRFENPDEDLTSFELYLKEGFKIIDSYFQDIKVNDLQKFIYFNQLVETAKNFNETIDINFYKDYLQKLNRENHPQVYNKIKQNLQFLETNQIMLGSQAPDFLLENQDNEKYSLSNFKQTIVIIDVWAGWCKPCISSFPKWNEMVAKYNNDKYSFVTVSIDENLEYWKQLLKKFELKGVALNAGARGFSSDFMKDYKISAIPAYIVIDGEGNLIKIYSSLSDLDKEIF